MTSRSWPGFLTAHEGTTLTDKVRATARRHGSWTTILIGGIYMGCLAAFITDLLSTNTLAFGVFYAPLIVTAVFHQDRRAVWVLTAIACVMVVIGSLLPVIPRDVSELVENRILSVFALLATAAFMWHARNIQDRLAEQTRRAEAAESIKSEVLTNLSQEIRAPLYSMVGVLELVASDSRPDQKAALGMVRSSGRRLAATIDNLVDLTQFDDVALPIEAVELGQLLRQTAEACRSDAIARQIALTIDIPAEVDPQVRANSWAVRRILENKISDAIIYTPPGGRVAIRIVENTDHLTVLIDASGTWPPGAFKAADDPGGALLVPSVMGLALSQRLARAMDARLEFSNRPDEGTTVRLRLPAITPEDDSRPATTHA